MSAPRRLRLQQCYQYLPGFVYEEDGESLFEGTRRPIEAWPVEDFLRSKYGIEDPWLLPWKTKQKPGLARPFGKPGHA